MSTKKLRSPHKEQIRQIMAEEFSKANQADRDNKQKRPTQDKQLLILKALETVLHGKPVSSQVAQQLPKGLVQMLNQTLQEQEEHRKLNRPRTLPERLTFLVRRLQARGVLDKPTKQVDPMDLLSPRQRLRQKAVESLELRRQNAVQMVQAQRLLPRQTP